MKLLARIRRWWHCSAGTYDPMEIPSGLTWYVPSFLGDLRLEAEGSGKAQRTRLRATQVTQAEKRALDALSKYALKKKWVETWPAYSGLDLPEIVLAAPIAKVAPLVAKALKPGRQTVSAVQFENGQMVEIAEAATNDDGKRDVLVLPDPYRELPPPAPKAATTVAAPQRGCPAPDFAQAEVKARGVLAAFLSPEQLEDFQRYNRFISVGATTGHRYMITSRHARDLLSTYQRTLYDLDEETPLCVHDWDVPAAEEMLALHVCVSLPGYEEFVRYLRD